MKSVTIILPIFNLYDRRLKNFEILVKEYLSKIEIPVIVIEQLNNTPSNIISIIKNISNITYISHHIDDNNIHKATLINQALEQIQTKYTWMLDCDVLLSFKTILDLLDDQDVIKPFRAIIKLTEVQSDIFLKDKILNIEKGEQVKLITKFGPMSFIIKTDIFKQNKMNESFTGYGWEDMDFAYRIVENYKPVEIDNIGMHFYHDIPRKDLTFEKINQDIFFKNRKLTFHDIKPTFHDIKPTFHDIKLENKYDLSIFKNKESNHIKIVHVITPALLKGDLYKREKLAIESIIEEKAHFNNIETIMICESKKAEKYKEHFKIIQPSRTSRDIDDKRGLIYLSDVFKEACKYCSDDDILFYTNSDCCIAPGTYNRLENSKKEAVEYHRRDVNNDPKKLANVFSFPNVLKETGVDGLGLRKRFFIKNEYYIPDFFIGEPHWDTAVCGALRTAKISAQNTIDLYHPYHDQTWTTKNLSVAGKHNDKIYRDFMEYGISNIRVLSKPEEQIETSIVMVHYGTNKLRVSAAKQAMAHLPYQNIINAEFIFVDVIKDKTLFPEIDNKPNWSHIILKEKDNNKDIFQKEAMMNIGARMTRGTNIIFIDTDVWTDDINWLNNISKRVTENPLRIVQGFSFCQDSKDADHVFVSSGLNTCKDVESSLHENPGLVFGMSKDMLVKNDYLNVYNIMGGGDSIILHEFVSKNHPHCNAWFQVGFPKWANILRTLPICGIMNYVDCNIIHENHGNVDFGYYGARHYATEYFTKDIKELVKIGDNGLLEWINPECIEREMIKVKFDMKTEELTRKICERIINKKK